MLMFGKRNCTTINQTGEHMELHSVASCDDERNNHQNLKLMAFPAWNGYYNLTKLDGKDVSGRGAWHIYTYLHSMNSWNQTTVTIGTWQKWENFNYFSCKSF